MGRSSPSELHEWIEQQVEERQVDLARHFIPQDEALWHPEEFDRFCEAGQQLITASCARWHGRERSLASLDNGSSQVAGGAPTE